MSTTYIFESPDNGKTIYRREFGAEPSTRELVEDAPVNAPIQTMEEFDKCVLCGELTPYKKSDHVDTREFYVEGAGQLCGGCYGKVY